MTLRRTALKPGKPLARGGPLAPVSESRRSKLAAAGVVLRSTFAPKLARTPPSWKGTCGKETSLAAGASGVEESTGRDGPGSGRPSRGHRGGHRIDRDSAAVVRERSGGRCEIGIEGCWGTARDQHHRVSQKSGGRHRQAARSSDRPSNVMDSCRRCHLVVTDHPKFAYTNGWSLREGHDPLREPVLYRGELSYLDDAGSVHAFDKAGA
jgi:hypothetical protein